MSHLLSLICLAALVAVPAGAQSSYDHKAAFEHYEGTKTCLTCHAGEAKTFFASQHYQWRGYAPDIVNAKGRRLGKLNTINDFCTGPATNWIGEVKNGRGEVVAKGCSKCHAGSGLKPEETMSQAQLENIDCLMCHAKGYNRDLVKDASGAWAWKPVLWKNQEGLDSVAKRISAPTRTMCLRCHAASGGGPNYKRGDIEYTLAEPPRDFDVHMSKDGADFQCTTCHAGKDHRVRGRGADLSGTDSPKDRLSCDNTSCHGPAPHEVKVLNHHAKRVYCTACHVPDFARDEATDMMRDWSQASYNKEADKYTATITLQKNVTPVYAWFNGTTKAQLPGDPVTLRADKTVGMMVPVGSRRDLRARLYPFKLHRAKLPVLDGKRWIIPMVVEEFFGDGNIDRAVTNAAHEFYQVENASYTWADTTRYMGIFHGVRPAKQALGCLDCHGPKGRMDWKTLGYAGDPLDAAIAPPRPAAGAAR